MTNLSPLLSTFTPATSCASYTGMTVFYTGNNFWWAEGPMSTEGCYPSSYSPGPDDYYSPGVCPSGYTTACTSLNLIGTVTETIHTCCPTALGISFDYAPTTNPLNTLACTTSFTAEVTITDPIIVSNGYELSTLAAISSPSGGGIGAYGIAVRYQASDFLTLSSTAAALTTSLIAGTTSVVAASTGSNAVTSHGLSSGANAGIGVGVAAVVLAMAIGIFLIWRKRRGRRNSPISANKLSAEKCSAKVHEIASQEIHEVSGLESSELPA